MFGTKKTTLKGVLSELDNKIEEAKEDTEKLNDRITKYSSEYKRDNRELVSKFMSEVYGESDGIYGLLEKNSSSFRQTASSITAKVTQVDRNLTTKIAEVSIKADEIRATVSANYNSLNQSISAVSIKANQIQTKVTQIDGDITTAQSTITQQATQISLRVEKNKVISEINQSSESIKIAANKVDITGLVTFTHLQTAGQTIINGGNITTGTLDCSKITVTNLNAGSITTGTFNASRIGAGILDCSKITVSNLSADSITTGNFNASRISGGILDCSKITVNNLNANSITSGVLEVSYLRANNYRCLTVGSSNTLLIGGTSSYNDITNVKIPATSCGVGSINGVVGFFGASGTTKTTISNLATSATLSDVISKINSMLTYGRSLGFN